MGGFRKAYYNYIRVILPNTTDIIGAFSFFTNIGVITQDNFTKTLIISVIIFVLFYLLSKIAYYVLNKYLSKATKYTGTDLDDCVFPVFASIIKNFIVFCGALVSILFFFSSVAVIYASQVWIFVYVSVVVFFAISISRILSVISRYYVENICVLKEGHDVDKNAMYFFSKILHLVLFIVATSIIFSILGFDLLPLITSVGIIGLAIALAAQQTVKDFIGGILLVTDKPFRHSDYVRVGDFDGRVVKIGLRTTQIKTTTNSILIVPNSDITSQNIINYSVNNEAVRYELKIGVEYGSDISNVRKILLSAASKSKFVSKEKKPEVYFLDFGEYSLNFSVLIRVNFLNRRKARDDVNTNIYIYIMHLKNTKLRYLFPSVLFI